MHPNLIEKRRLVKPNRFHFSYAVVDRRRRHEPVHLNPRPAINDDEEAKFVTRAALWMAVLGATPLILFYIVHFFWPELFLIPITPNLAEYTS